MKRRDFLSQTTRFLVFSSLLALEGLGLSACSDKTASTQNSNGKPIIKIGYLPITDHLVMLAHALGEFKQLQLEPVKFSSWPELSEALKAEAIQGAFALTPIGITLRNQGVPIKAVLLGHRNGSVITVKVDDRIKGIGDLKGRTIAIPSKFSTHNLLLRKLLTEQGLEEGKDVELLDMAPPEMVNALATGRIDGYIVAEPFGAQAEMQKVGKVLILSRDIWPNHICCALNLREELLQSQPQAVQELVTRFIQAGQFIESNPGEAARMSTRYFGQKPEVIEFVLTKPADRVTYNNLLPRLEDFAATQELMLKYGVATKKLDLQEYVLDSFAVKGYGV